MVNCTATVREESTIEWGVADQPGATEQEAAKRDAAKQDAAEQDAAKQGTTELGWGPASSDGRGFGMMIRDGEVWRVAQHCVADLALRVLDVLGDDPANWQDMVALWSRSRSAEEQDDIQLEDIQWTAVDQSAWRDFSRRDAWFIIDLVECRLLLGGRLTEFDLLLPPWWECDRSGQAERIETERSEPLRFPCPSREVLWGQAVCQFFAAELMDRVWRDGKLEMQAFKTAKQRYEVSVEIHRDWLLAPRLDLAGRSPRQVIHEAWDWVEQVVETQRQAICSGMPAVPLPTTLSTFLRAPWGFNEMVMYFEACRAILERGWELLVDWSQHRAHLPDGSRNRIEQSLWQSLREHLHLWLVHDQGEEWTPAEIIQQERLRVPLVESPGKHVLDCNCPICRLMADGTFGPSFVHFDGYALEMDGEFAFSQYSSEEEWESNRLSWDIADANLAEESTSNSLPDSGSGNEGNQLLARATAAAVDQAGSDSWLQPLAEEVPPAAVGSKLDTLLMSFQLAEIIAVLEDSQANQPTIDRLNEAFTATRTDNHCQRQKALRHFTKLLSQVGNNHPAVASLAAKLIQRLSLEPSLV